MNKFFIQIIFFLFITLSLSSCKTNRIASSGKVPKVSFKKLNNLIDKNAFEFSDFSTKIRVNYNKQNFTANIRMKKDSIIWASFTGPFNIEGARVLITKDSFQLIDRINRVYYHKPIAYMEKFIPVDISLYLIQELLIGNFFEGDIKKQKIETKDRKYFVKGYIKNFETTYTINPGLSKMEKAEIQNTTDNQLVVIELSNYEKVENQQFSMNRNFLIRDKGKENLLDLRYYKLKEEKQIFPFKIPERYQKVY